MKRKRVSVSDFDGRVGGRKSANTSLVSRKEVNRLVKSALSRAHDLKVVDVGFGGTADTNLAANTNITILNGVNEGTGIFKRLDSKIKMKSLRVKFGLVFTYQEQALTGNVGCTSCRVSIVLDRKPNGAIPLWSNIFSNLDKAGTFVQDLRSNLSATNTERFRVLRDEIIPMNPQYYHKGGLSLDKDEICFERDWFIDLKQMQSTYESASTASGIADFESNVIYFIIRTSVGDVHHTTNYAGNARLRFIDE